MDGTSDSKMVLRTVVSGISDAKWQFGENAEKSHGWCPPSICGISAEGKKCFFLYIENKRPAAELPFLMSFYYIIERIKKVEKLLNYPLFFMLLYDIIST